MITTPFLAFLTTSAQAALVGVEVCVKYQTDFDDASLGLPASRRDDFFTDNQNRPALGATIIAIPHGGSGPIEQTASIAAVGTIPAGCTTFLLDHELRWDFRIKSEAQIDDVTIDVRQAPGTSPYVALLVPDPAYVNECPQYDPAVGFLPLADVTRLYLQTANVHRAWNVSAAMGFAVKRRSYGFAGQTLKAFTDDPSPCGGQGSCQSGDALFFDPAGTDISRRYKIVHELGHLLGWHLDEQLDPHVHATASAGTCDNFPGGGNLRSQMATREHASQAAVEGFAHYYAAIVFNDRTEPECSFVYWKNQDFYRDQTQDYAFANDAMSCEGSPIWDPALVSAKDYLAEFCGSGSAIEDRGTELDWLRFFWDLDSDQNVGFDKIADLWDAAGPNTWQAVGIPTRPDPTEVWQRIHDAAAIPMINIQAAVEAQADNGVSH